MLADLNSAIFLNFFLVHYRYKWTPIISFKNMDMWDK